MTPEAQRIAIAEACGWSKIWKTVVGRIYGLEPRGVGAPEIPDYLNDLNAMHEAEKVLDGEQSEAYAKLLSVSHPTYCVSVLDGRDPEGDFWFQTFDLIHATAAQRALAFIKTLGLDKNDSDLGQ